MTTGTLYLIPTNLASPIEAEAILPGRVLDLARQLDCFVVENAKTARGFLKAIGVTRPLAEIKMQELNEHSPRNAVDSLLEPLRHGQDVGLLSEAGAPAIADPGAELVAAAHQEGIRVVPLVGPSSLLLGLMASGLNGQSFAFHGYLPAERTERAKVLADLERESKRRRMTQLFIETPYRNDALLADLLKTLGPSTRVCLAIDLTGAGEKILRGTVGDWRQAPPVVGKVPALFLFLA